MSKEKLLKKIHAEEKEFIDAMMLRSPAEIIEAAYEIAHKRDIICILETTSIPDEQAKAIGCLANSLDFFYWVWMDCDGDSLKDAIDYALTEEWKHILVTEAE